MQETWDAGSIPGSGRSPGGGHGNPLQYFCLENAMDWGAWKAIVHRLAKSWYDWSDWARMHMFIKPRYILDIFPGKWQQQWLTRPQLIIKQDCRLPTDLAAEKTSCLDSESIIMTQFQVGNFKEIVRSIPKVSWDIHDTIKHVYLVALKTNTGGTAQEVKQGSRQLLLWVTTLYELLPAGTDRC